MPRFSWSILVLTFVLFDGWMGASAEEALRVGAAERYRTVSAALAAAKTGSVIEVTSGTYPETLVIRKTVEIRGVDAGGGMPVIDGRGDVAPIRVEAGSVVVEGLAVTSTGSPLRPLSYLTPYLEEACILIVADKVVVRGNRLSGCAQGIYVRNSDGFVIEDNEVTGNHRGGMMMLNSHRGRVAGNVVADNGIFQGIAVHSFSFLKGYEYSARASGLVGDWWKVTAENRDVADILSEEIEIAGNTVTGHGGAGIAVSFGRRINIVGNEVHHNGGAEPIEAEVKYFQLELPLRERGAGILLYCDAYENTVRDNRVYENDNMGIQLGGAHWNRIENNLVETNPYGILVTASVGNTLIANRVKASAEFGIRVEGGLYEIFSIATTVVHNDLDNPGVNAFDDTGTDNPAPGSGWLDVFPIRKLPPYPLEALKRANSWDDGVKGNRFSDFDEEPEGFRDADGDGIGETPHAIPGGASVDRFPLAGPGAGARKAEAAIPRLAGSPACGTDGACGIDPGLRRTLPCPG